jgi:hypothetical protein
MATESKKTITISGILADLENGLTRVQVGEKYKISPREVKALFDHPKLKGKKAKKSFALSFEIEDDTEVTTENVVEEVVENAAEEASSEVDEQDSAFE